MTIRWYSKGLTHESTARAAPLARNSSNKLARRILSRRQQLMSNCMWAALNISSTARLICLMPTCNKMSGSFQTSKPAISHNECLLTRPVPKKEAFPCFGALVAFLCVLLVSSTEEVLFCKLEVCCCCRHVHKGRGVDTAGAHRLGACSTCEQASSSQISAAFLHSCSTRLTSPDTPATCIIAMRSRNPLQLLKPSTNEHKDLCFVLSLALGYRFLRTC